MMSAVRTPKKSVVAIFIGTVVALITLYAFKDMNEKLTVMTVSNAGYQQMTDSQSEKIRSLLSEISDLKELQKKNIQEMEAREEELKSKLSKAENEISELASVQRELDKLRSEFETLSKNHLRTTEELNRYESEHSELQNSLKELEKERDKASIELRDQIAKLSVERDNCKRQYEALFKQQQDASDKVGELRQETQRLRLQIDDLSKRPPEPQISTENFKVNPQMSSSSVQVVLQPVEQPNGGPPSSSTKRDQPVILEEPQADAVVKGPTGVSSTTQGAKSSQDQVGIAEPPLAAAVQPPNQPEVVHLVGKEDVMEAPYAEDRDSLQPVAVQQQPQVRRQPLRQPNQRLQVVQHGQQNQFLQQEQQHFHEDFLGQFRNHQPVLKAGYKNRNIVGGGANLDQEVDRIQQGHPDLMNEPVIRGHLAVDDYDDDAADGQLEDHYPVLPKQAQNFKNNEVEYDENKFLQKNIFAGQNFPAKNFQLKGKKFNNQLPLRYIGQPPPIQQYGRRHFGDMGL